MSIGVTGISIAPELGIHFHDKSLSFMERLCCCCGSKEARIPDLNDQMYIDDKMRAMRWQDKRCENGLSTTHARLKLIVVERLHKVSEHPFEDAQKAFEMSRIQWQQPQCIYREDLDRLNSAVARIKQTLLTDPLSLKD